MKQLSIGKDAAIQIGQSEWWKSMPAKQAVIFQFTVEELCMPFDVFQRLTGEVLGGSVFTHEFAQPEHLIKELLK